MTLKELLDIDARRFYRVMFSGSQYGRLYNTREEAEEKKKAVDISHEGSGYTAVVEELNGWQEEINEDNGVEYVEAAMEVVKKLKEDLDILQDLVRELLEQIVETEDRYEQ